LAQGEKGLCGVFTFLALVQRGMHAIADFARTALSMLNRKLLSSEFNTKKLFENGIAPLRGFNAIFKQLLRD
jgi:hypothetical protein